MLILDLPGVRIQVQTHSTAHEQAFRVHFQSIIVDQQDKCESKLIKLDVRIRQPHRERESPGGEVFRDREGKIVFKTPHFLAIYHQCDNAGSVFFTQHWSSMAIAAMFEQSIRFFFSAYIVRNGGALIHSAAVMDQDRAALFPGRGGDGKTTFSNLTRTQGGLVLCDDMNVLKLSGDAIWVEGFPRFASLAVNYTKLGPQQVGRIGLLKKGEATSWQPIRRTILLARLVSCTVYLNNVPDIVPHILNFYSKALENIPCGQMTFAKGGTVFPLPRQE